MKRAVLVAMVVAVVLAAACSGGSKQAPPTPTTGASETATTVGTATQEATEAVPTAPPRGGPCPLDPDLCQMAAKVEMWVSRGDVAAVMGALSGKSYTCPEPGTSVGPGSLYYVCAGAGAGEVRTGFAFGEAPLAPAEFSKRLTDFIATRPISQTPDAWGGPEQHVAAVGCHRALAPGEHICDDRALEISITLIGKIAGLFLPGQRTVYELTLHRDSDGLWIDGIGLAVPPVAQLYPLDIGAWLGDATTVRVSRPWRP